VTEQVSYPYKITDKIMVLYILIFMFSEKWGKEFFGRNWEMHMRFGIINVRRVKQYTMI
jgi:hypothetical protein